MSNIKITHSNNINNNSNSNKLTVYDKEHNEIGTVIKKEISKPRHIENYNNDEFTINNNEGLVKIKSLKR